MYTISDFLNRPVLSLYEGELLGNVQSIQFDKRLKKILMLEVKSAESIETYFLPVKNIYNVGKHAITVKNNQSIMLKESIEPIESVKCPIGSKAYTIHGELQGVISALEFDDNYLISKILLENEKEIDVNKLASCSNNTVIVYDEKSTVNVGNFKFKKLPKLFKTKKVVEVKTMPTEEIKLPPENNATIQSSAQPTNIILPNKTEVNNKFLLNRRVVKDIFGFNNELLIKNNSKITEQVIKTASKNGKLRELMIFSK